MSGSPVFLTPEKEIFVNSNSIRVEDYRTRKKTS